MTLCLAHKIEFSKSGKVLFIIQCQVWGKFEQCLSNFEQRLRIKSLSSTCKSFLSKKVNGNVMTVQLYLVEVFCLR